MPSTATIHSALLGAQMATRSPGSTPDATSAAPNGPGPLEQLGVGELGVAVDDGEAVAERARRWPASSAGMLAGPLARVALTAGPRR